MALTLKTAPTEPEDVEFITKFGLRAFEDSTNLIVYHTLPLSATSFQQLVEKRQAGLAPGKPRWAFKAIDASTNTIIGSSRWQVYTEPEDIGPGVEAAVEKLVEEYRLPEIREEGVRLLFTTMLNKRLEVLGVQPQTTISSTGNGVPPATASTHLDATTKDNEKPPHFYLRPRIDLDSLFTNPEHQGRGVGKLLLQWGFDEADRLGLDVYLEATDAGLPFYKKCGFEDLGACDVDMSPFGIDRIFTYTSMIRRPKRMTTS